MYVIILIGGARQGKTPFIKEYSKGKKLLVWDIQNEYGARTKYKGDTPTDLSNDTRRDRSRFITIDPDLFIKECNKKRGTICVFEEATMFFQGITSSDMRKLIFSKAHTSNIYILVFHSINSVPPRIMESSDYVVLFKTSDEEKTVERKYPRLLQAYKNLQSEKDGVNVKIKMI